ncbi:MAG: hypothetical protein SGJ24_04465 [Chloroflexota bacterium]|nr:hypothetical protein [Chloroflexota bacterium]
MADYTTVQKVRATIGSQVSSADDDVITRLISAVSRQIDRYCNRLDGFEASATATARVFPGRGETTLWIDECAAVTLVEGRESVSSAWTGWTAGDWIPFSGDDMSPNFNKTPYHGLMVMPSGTHSVFPHGAYSSMWVFDTGRRQRGIVMTLPTVQVTARWGYALSVPDDVENACIIQTARMYKRGQSAYADTLATSDFGTMQYRKLDPEVEAILTGGRYIRPRV